MDIKNEIGKELAEATFLSQLAPGESGIIVKVKGHGAFRKRIIEMGFVKGKKVTVVKQAPLNDPMEYEIMGYNISLRKSEASLIEIIEESGITLTTENPMPLSDIEAEVLRAAAQKGKSIHIALAGNPNCGKTTLFNYTTGSHERVGNYGGVTVESKEGFLTKFGYKFILSDLPGTYSITEYTPEELYVRSHLLENRPDVVLNVVDSTNLERNLYLTSQLMDMNIKVVIALNMYDELQKTGTEIDHCKLGELLGIPVIPTTANKGNGIGKLLKKIIEVYEDQDTISRHVHVHHGNEIEKSISRVQEQVKKTGHIKDLYSTRYLAIKLLEKDQTTHNLLSGYEQYTQINDTTNKEISKLEEQYKESSEAVMTDAKYGFIDGALKECVKYPELPGRKIRNLDDILTHKYFGLPIFIAFMWLMFQTTFSLGNYPMELIEKLVSATGSLFSSIIAEGPLRDLVVNGIIDGVGGVVVFLPNILILFFFISFMEDSGYMARAAFIMDKLMHKIGLHGKSFIPLVMGFGCNVPAVMATRTLESKSDRILTTLLVPFMSCSARLPVYVLLISAFFPKNQGLVLSGIYFTGILMAVILALILKKLVFKKQEIPFVMELPPYRIPTLKSTSRHMWHKGYQYLKKMGSVILAASVIIWAMGYFPREFDRSAEFDSRMESIQNDYSITSELKTDLLSQLEAEKESLRLENSYIGQLGHSLAPVMEPLGFDWKMGVSIISGLPAKEIVVSTMSVLYQAPGADEESDSLIAGIKSQLHQSGEKAGQRVFDPVVALAFMVFILIYFPCVATIVAIGKESGWQWAAFSMVYTTLLAWVMAYAVYNIGNLL